MTPSHRAEGRPEETAPPPPDAATPATEEAPAPASPAPTTPPPGSWRTIGRSLAPRATRAQLMAGLLCALVGFALVVQVQQNRTEGLASLSQDELVRILDEVTQRTEELEEQAADLRTQRQELLTGTDTQRAALEAAIERAEVQGVLSGRLPAVGPGVSLAIREPQDRVPALVLYNVLEELRNAGAEAVQLNDIRLTASSYFLDVPDGVEVDGVVLEPPYRWLAIGDPAVIEPALNIPGGALASVRAATGVPELTPLDEVEITAVREPTEPEFATPVPPQGP